MLGYVYVYKQLYMFIVFLETNNTVLQSKNILKWTTYIYVEVLVLFEA